MKRFILIALSIVLFIGLSVGTYVLANPDAILIGSAAINRGSSTGAHTLVNKAATATGTGTISTVEIYTGTGLSNCEVATFFVVSGNNLSTRDTEVIGAVTGGSKQTFSGLDMDVVTGDYLGTYYTAGNIDLETSGGSGVWFAVSADNIPCENVLFTLIDDFIISLYGTGETAGVVAPTPTSAGTPSEVTPIVSIISLIPFTFFGILAYWKLNTVLFLITGGTAMMTGLYWYEIFTSDIGISVALLVIAFGLVCFGFAFKLIFWKEPPVVYTKEE